MRTLTLVRHGKSSWKYDGLEDFERPLNQRGRADVPLMAQRLGALSVLPDCVLSSYATRALTTARLFARQLGFPIEKIQLSEALYSGCTESLYDALMQLDERYNDVCLFGHNPEFTGFANELCSIELDNIPTAGFVHISVRVAHWHELSPGAGELLVFDYPKK